MKESDRTVPMLYERNDAYVIEAFRQGEFDYLEGVGEVSEADFFRALTGRTSCVSWPIRIPLLARSTMFPCGSMWPVICRCGFMGPFLSCLSLRGPFWRDDPGLWS